MTYELALAYLASLNESRIRPGLERIKEALLVLGSPHLKFPHVLVGGTNGKGSVVSFMGSVLSEAGYRTGLFTSPHLSGFEERVVTAGSPLTRSELTGLVKAVKDTGVELTYFEFAAALAILHFANEKVDMAVLEVGIGGTWDATNAVDPVISVITTVEADHQEWLGHRLEDIALEKSGIMRSGRPVVLGSMGGEVRDVLLEQARAVGARAIFPGRDYVFTKDVAAHSLHFKGARWKIKDLVPRLKGEFQLDNAACALAALEALAASGTEVSREDAVGGVLSAEWPGRFQVFEGTPPIIVDAAHNLAAIRALTGSLAERKEVVWLFSALVGKDIKGMTVELARTSPRFVLVPMDHPKANTLKAMEDQMPEVAKITRCYSVRQGMDKARSLAGRTGCVVIAGSVVLAGEVLEVLSTRYPVPSTKEPGARSQK